MTNVKGRNANFSDSATIEKVELNNTTSVKIADANKGRTFFHINSNGSPFEVWIKLQPAHIDNDKKGIFLHKSIEGGNFWEMPEDNIYTGEISAIAVNGSPTIYVTEY